ncbi:PP2C family protein-serine/threonine phosphatase [Serinibacter salmoneus]|uniref:Serine/threonine protein phosphatase PrpC n=1 Tax=Serinibacter salmoneus TaxID=556530 RepID=A0A2A9CXE3_9MICO|nr:serine/threonine protein phosphatase [Serinibacter salmoneus]PFG18806.1 serine/threonine protein phosphatase PrpC [Serinibacter salmoneus]
MAARCPECGDVFASDGYCLRCGTPAPSERDHVELCPSPGVAGVSDRGRERERNEDALDVLVPGLAPAPAWGTPPPSAAFPAASEAPPGLAAVVVCDGVAAAPRSEVASLAAVQAATARIGHGLGAGGGDLAGAGGPAHAVEPSQALDPADTAELPRLAAVDRGEVLCALTAAGARAASRAVTRVTADLGDPAQPPSATYLAVIVEQPAGCPDDGQLGGGQLDGGERVAAPLVAVGWLGDCRCYWLPDEGEARLITRDHSWAAELMASGMSPEEAARAPQAHAITRWIGIDAPDDVASTARFDPPGPGWVLACSDGLWNYAAEPQAIARVLLEVSSIAQPASAGPAAAQEIASGMVAWANAQGGRDNITAALIRISAR